MAKKRSLTIIDKTKPPSCPFVYTPPPTFGTKIEKARWLEEEKRRWIEGYNDDVNGFHYFYLTQCFIKIGTGGAIERPKWRDCDAWILQDFAKARELGYDHGLISRREIGKTSIGGGLLPNYFMRVYTGSTSLLTSCDKPRIFRMFNDKTITVYDNLDPDIRGKIERTNQTKDNVYLKVKFPVKNEHGEAVYRYSDIFCSETVDNPSAFSSTRAIYGYYDEFALHEKGAELLKSSEPCFREGTKKTGTVMWAGTVEEGVPAETLKRLRTIVGDSKNSNTVITFAPFWWGLNEFSVNGHSNEKLANEWREKELERLSKLEDKTKLRAFEKNYPATLDEALGTATEGTLPPEVMTIIAEQRKAIENERPPVNNYDIVETADDFELVLNPKAGKFTVLSYPDPNKSYSAGTDPIPFNNSHITDGSEYAIIIYEDDTDTPVAYYAERSLDADIITINSIKLQRLYNDAKTMLERNVGGVILEKYKDYDSIDLLANAPTSLGIKFAEKRAKKGYWKNDRTAAKGNQLLIKWMLQHGHNIWFKRLLDELEMFLVENTDLLDAFQALLFKLEDRDKKEIKKMKKPVYKEIPFIDRDERGRTFMNWKKIRIDGQEEYEEESYD